MTIEMNFEVSHTSPTVRGTYITVDHIVNLIVDGWMWSDILRTHPELSENDIRACLSYNILEDVQAEVLIGDRYVNLTDFKKEKILIAYRLPDERVICLKCALIFDLVSHDADAIYAIDIIPYSQSCHKCGERIVIGRPCQLYGLSLRAEQRPQRIF